MMADPYPPGTRVRKISAKSGPILAGSLGTIVEAAAINDVPAYIVVFDLLPGVPVITPAARLRPIKWDGA
jgi:hypothetical protein